MNYKKKTKNRYWMLVVAMFLLISTAITVWAQGSGENQGYRTIRVVDVSGRASVVKDGIEYEAYPGMLLQEGQEVATAGNSHIRLALDDDKYIKIESGSRAVFETLGLLGTGKTKIALERGAMTNELVRPLRADESYIVSTPNAVLAVRGTFFRVDLAVSETGDITADVKTYGGQVASQRIQPTGEIVDEEVLIEAGYMTTINMTPVVTHYVIETADGEKITVEPDAMGNVAVDGTEPLPTRPISLNDISDEDLVDVYFAAENGHELFVTTEDAKATLEERNINVEDYTSVYEKAEKIKEEQDIESTDNSAIIGNTTDARVIANDSRPIAIVEKTEDDSETTVAKNEDDAKKKPLTDGDGNANNMITDEEEQTEDILVQEDSDDSEQVADNDTSSSQPGTGDTNPVPGIVIGGITPEPTPIPPVDDEEEPHVHTETTTTVAATCTTAGKTTISCSECGEILSETESVALGHNYSTEYTIDVEPTCSSTGRKSRHCSRCTSTTEELGIAAIDHTPTTNYIDGTETAEGAKQEICSVCEEVLDEIVLVSIPLHFPDDVFAQMILDDYDTDGHNSLSAEELEEMKKVSGLSIFGHVGLDGNYVSVKSFQGIEYFPNLEVFDCSDNTELTSLDLSKNPNLTHLTVSNTAITDLNVANTALFELNVTSLWNLQKLDITNVPLTYLQVNSETIEEIDLSTNTQLEYLDVTGCHKLASLNLYNCPELTTFRASNTQIEQLMFTSNTKLSSLMLDSNEKLTYLDLTGCESVKSVDLESNNKIEILMLGGTGVTTVDTSSLENLWMLNVTNTNIETLDLSQNTKLSSLNSSDASLKSLRVNAEPLTSLNVTKNTGLQELTVKNCSGLSKLDLSKNTELATLELQNTAIKELSLANNTKLESLNITGCNSMTTVDIAQCAVLKDIYIKDSAVDDIQFYNSLAAENIDIINCDSFTGMIMAANEDTPYALKNIKIEDCNAITMLILSYMPNFETIDLSGCDKLRELRLGDMAISEVDLSDNIGLEIVVTARTNLETLDLSKDSYPNLATVEVENDTVKTLDVSGCANLNRLRLCDTIETLNIAGCKKITNLLINDYTDLVRLDCSNSGLTSLFLGYSMKLEEVRASGCTSLRGIGISNSTQEVDHPLTTLIADGCTSLTEIAASHSPSLTTLEISDCPSLAILDVSKGGIASLDLTENASLQTLDVSGTTSLSAIDFGNTTDSQIVTINAANSEVETIFVKGCQKLTSLALSEKIRFLDVSECASLSQLELNGCSNLMELNVNGCTSLETLLPNSCVNMERLYCSDSGIKSLNLVYNSKLEMLDADNCINMTSITIHDDSFSDVAHDAFVSISIEGCTNLGSVTIGKCPNLSSIGIGTCPNLTYLDISQSGIDLLDVVNNSKLEQLHAYGATALRSLDFAYTDNSQLWVLNIADSGITDLSLAGCDRISESTLTLNDKIEKLNVNSCIGLNSLDLSVCAGTLKNLQCTYTNLPSLDISMCTNLEELYVNGSSIPSLNLTNNTKLKTLACAETNISSLDLSNQPSLESLSVGSTQITTLDLSGNTELREFSGISSPIEDLNLSNTKVTTFSTHGMDSLVKFTAEHSSLETLYLSGTQDNYNTTLQEVSVMGSENFGDMELYYCSALTSVDVSSTGIRSFALIHSDNLETINATDCLGLDSIVVDSNQLSTLDIRGCDAISSLTVSNCPNLDEVDISACQNIQEITLDNVAISGFTANGYTGLTDLFLGNAPNLLTVVVNDCTNLKNFNLVNNFSMTGLSARGCTSLTELETSTCNALVNINVTDCTNLTSIYTGGRYGNGLTVDGAPDGCRIE